jgi:hypothetical protein
VFPKAANKLVGTKFKVVLGYPGSTEILLAMERGEVEGFCGIGWTFLKLRKGDWLKDKKINILYQMSLEKHPDCPTFRPSSTTPRHPTTARFSNSCSRRRRWGGRSSRRPASRRSACAPCGAFAQTLKDPQFLADADKMGVEVQHVGGEQIQQLVERIYASPPEVIARAKAVAE